MESSALNQGMLSVLIVVLYFVFGALLAVAQSSASQSIVCVVDQCLQGYSNISLGETLSAQGDTAVHLLPGKYTSTTSPDLLHTLLTSSSAALSQSPGFNLSSVNPLPIEIALLPGIAIYSNSLFGGQAAFSQLPSSPVNSSIPLPAGSLALSNNVWIALIPGSSSNPIIFWDTIPDVSQLPPEASPPLALVNIQSSACSPPCSGSGICSASATCSCPPGFTGSACEACANGFFGPKCQPCPSECESCDQGISGSGRCFVPIIGNAPATCNCANGQCSTDGACTCNPGWTNAANGTACAQCAPGFFMTSAGNCQICQIGCGQCTDDTGACIACNSGFSQDENDQTLCNPLPSTTSSGTPCPDGSYSAGQECAPCSSSCQTCNGPSSNNCIVCAAKLSLFQGTCVTTDSNGVCAGTNGMIADNVKQECDACGAKCTACKIPNFNAGSTVSSIQCTDCLPGFFLSQGQCVETCPSGTFVSPQDNLTCTACSSTCGTCLGSADYCLTCPNEQLAFTGQCVASCPTGTFSSSGACLQCHPDCASCTGSSFNQCSACSTKLPVLTAGRCLPTCGQSEYFNPTSSTCQNCDSSCSSCSDSGPTHCLACSSSSQVLRAGSCVVANCTESSNVIPGLGVCLSDLVQMPPNFTTSTSTSASSSSSGPVHSGTAQDSTTITQVHLLWWQILLMVLGCIFILALILVLWRRCARKQRAEETAMFVSAKHLDGGNGWKWRLQQFKRFLFGGKKGGYDADNPPMTYFGDVVTPPHSDAAVALPASPTTSFYFEPMSPRRPPRSIHRPSSRRRHLDNPPSATRHRSSNPFRRTRYRSNDPSSLRRYPDETPLSRRYDLDSPSSQRRYDMDSPSSPRRYYSDEFFSMLRYPPNDPSPIMRHRSHPKSHYDDDSLSRYPNPLNSGRPERSSRLRALNYNAPPPSYPSNTEYNPSHATQ